MKKQDTAIAAKTEALPALPMNENELKAMYGDMTAEDFKVPRLVLLEGLSPEVAEGLGKPGDLFLKGLNMNLGSAPLEVVVLMRFKTRICWRDLSSGGGILCRANDGKTGMGEPGGACAACTKTQWVGQEQPECSLYENFIVWVRDPSKGVPLPIALSGTKGRLGTLKDFNTMLEIHRLQNRPFFDKVYTIKPTQKSNPRIASAKYHVFGIAPGNDNKLLNQDEVKGYYELFKKLSQQNLVVEQDQESGATPTNQPEI